MRAPRQPDDTFSSPLLDAPPSSYGTYYSMADKKNHGYHETLHVREFIQRRADERARLRILEIGCGTAGIIPFLPSNVSYSGIDPTEPVIDSLAQQYPQHFFTVGIAEKLPVPDSSVDIVMSFFVLEHTRDPRLALREMVRVLAPGGTLILLAPNHETPWSELNAIRHYTRFERYSLLALRWTDFFGRCIGRQRFRVIFPNYTEATQLYQKPDDDLRYITSAWETAAFLRSLGCKESYHHPFAPQQMTLRNRIKLALTRLPVLRYWGGSLFLFFTRGSESPINQGTAHATNGSSL